MSKLNVDVHNSRRLLPDESVITRYGDAVPEQGYDFTMVLKPFLHIRVTRKSAKTLAAAQAELATLEWGGCRHERWDETAAGKHCVVCKEPLP